MSGARDHLHHLDACDMRAQFYELSMISITRVQGPLDWQVRQIVDAPFISLSYSSSLPMTLLTLETLDQPRIHMPASPCALVIRPGPQLSALVRTEGPHLPAL